MHVAGLLRQHGVPQLCHGLRYVATPLLHAAHVQRCVLLLTSYYHSTIYGRAGGDTAVLNETGWVQDWVNLMTHVQQSDVCKVCFSPAHR